jgi:Na+/H+ antiporter NhaD/arsenite permease-like protein
MLVLPFVIFLLLIALGPIFFAKWWHKYYKHTAVFFTVFIIVISLILDFSHLHLFIHTAFEYISFITLLASLYFATAGIVIKTDENGTPLANSILLLIGAILASVIGTTGAAMILIRPFINMNKNRLLPYQKVFFIFIVCNAGGMLSPIGDPPLFMGFLKGIPFFWISLKTFPFWLLTNGLLIAVFYYFDRNKNPIQFDHNPGILNLKLEGSSNVLFLFLTLVLLFVDPNIPGMDWVPYIPYHELKLSFIREISLIILCWASYRYTDKALMKKNDFTTEPIKEVAFIFMALFFTMSPALILIAKWSSLPSLKGYITNDFLYLFTGICSSVLDNAPSYLTALSASMGSVGLDINLPKDIMSMIESKVFSQVVVISVASVIFGACTYLGNAPNFMVKAVAEQKGIKMPSFFEYIFKFTLPILVPILFANWVLIKILY